MNRRSFLLGLPAGALAATSLGASMQGSTQIRSRRPKNLIFLVSDGMSIGTLSIASQWLQRNHNGELDALRSLLSNVPMNVSFQNTGSANSPVTDSAAAASAWGGGERVYNGSLNVRPDGSELTPLYVLAKDAGYTTALVTTTRMTHATPAGFAANARDRGLEDRIARQYLSREIDCLLGGGSKHFTHSENAGLLDRYRAADYAVVEHREALENLDVSKVSRMLGVFYDDHLPYRIDRRSGDLADTVPTLPEMMEKALSYSKNKGGGYFMMVEAGRVDHAGHANDPGAILHDQLEFDACVTLGLQAIREDPETLLIVTTDHGCGGCQLNGLNWQGSSPYSAAGARLDKLSNFNASFEHIYDSVLAGASVGKTIEASLGFRADPEVTDKLEKKIRSSDSWAGIIGEELAPQLLEMTGIGWTSQHHTSELVQLLTFGAGCHAFPNYLPNNQVFDILADLFEVRRG